MNQDATYRLDDRWMRLSTLLLDWYLQQRRAITDGAEVQALEAEYATRRALLDDVYQQVLDREAVGETVSYEAMAEQAGIEDTHLTPPTPLMPTG